MNNSSIDVFQEGLLLTKEKGSKQFDNDSLFSEISKFPRTPHEKKTKSLHKSQLNRTSLFLADNSQFNSQGFRFSKNLSKNFSESKISYKDNSVLLKKTLFGESMIGKLQKWEQEFVLDCESQDKLSHCFSDLDHKIQLIETQFANILHFGKKMESELLENWEFTKGWSFLKISFKNPKKSSNRTVFFSPNLEAICWKDSKNRFPKAKQLIFLKDIRKISTNPPRTFSGKDSTLYFCIESSQRNLDLLAPNLQIKELFIRLLNTHIRNFKQRFGKDEETWRIINENRELGFINEQHSAQIEMMKKVINY